MKNKDKHNVILESPGAFLHKILNDKGMTQLQLAARIGARPKFIHDIIRGKSEINPLTALNFEKVLGIPFSVWLHLQLEYNINNLSFLENKGLLKQAKWLDIFPIDKMQKIGLIKSKIQIEILKEILCFFSVGSFSELKNIYFSKNPPAFNKMPLKFNKKGGLLAVWLRQGELQARGLEKKVFIKKNFRRVLADIKHIQIKNSKNFKDEITRLLFDHGILLIFIKPLEKMEFNVATRYVNNNPLIQFSELDNNIEDFWYNLYHSIGHILYYNKLEIYLEKHTKFFKKDDIEILANNFAKNMNSIHVEY